MKSTALFFLIASLCVLAISHADAKAHGIEDEPEFKYQEEEAAEQEAEDEVKPAETLIEKAKAAVTKAGEAIKDKYEEVVPHADRQLLAAAKNSIVNTAQMGAFITKNVLQNAAQNIKDRLSKKDEDDKEEKQ